MREQKTPATHFRLPKYYCSTAHLDPGCLFPATPKALQKGWLMTPCKTSMWGASAHCSEGVQGSARAQLAGSSSCCFAVGDKLL